MGVAAFGKTDPSPLSQNMFKSASPQRGGISSVRNVNCFITNSLNIFNNRGGGSSRHHMSPRKQLFLDRWVSDPGPVQSSGRWLLYTVSCVVHSEALKTIMVWVRASDKDGAGRTFSRF